MVAPPAVLSRFSTTQALGVVHVEPCAVMVPLADCPNAGAAQSKMNNTKPKSFFMSLGTRRGEVVVLLLAAKGEQELVHYADRIRIRAGAIDHASRQAASYCSSVIRKNRNVREFILRRGSIGYERYDSPG